VLWAVQVTHNVFLGVNCSRVQVLESHLEKKGHNIPTWHTRLFRFNPKTRTVSYWKKAASGDPLGELTVTGICDVPDRPRMRQNRFDILCHNQAKGATVIPVSAETLGLKESWMKSVGDVAGLQDAVNHPRFSEFASAGQVASAAAVEDSSVHLQVSVLQGRDLLVKEASGGKRVELCCTLVVLDAAGNELATEKKKSATSAQSADTVVWNSQNFLFGSTPEFGQASTLLVKLKDEGGADYGAVHIPLIPVLKGESAGSSEAWYPLELRKGMASVQGEVQLTVIRGEEPTTEQLAAVASDMMQSVELATRSYRLREYEAVFIGLEAVDYMLSSGAGGISFETADQVSICEVDKPPPSHFCLF
jgi:hypothetical protein